ncbi:HelD family protein [Dendrosporobacter sp. 1207_IL3150]|uniref:HelD family protein n=1 Tax=Dendrosporobacter sp. 1207_IL3150 TaxID=3084054 RepID=UPI002FD95AC9
MTESEREYEIARLKRTLEEISWQLAKANNKCEDSRVELQTNLADYWENYGGNALDEAQMIEALERQRGISAVIHKGQQTLQKAAVSPYFGRIDFIEEWSGETTPDEIYIGITTLTDHQTDDLLVYDWRAPVSGMYYDFERGKAWYKAPIGTVTGTITLKRQYKIINGQIKYMFDSDIKIDDEILQEILSKSADDKMHTIVTSIQREQNQIIRNEENKLLLVQGPAGSGKTSIALHRIAYLLYRDKASINSKNILIFSPNHIFSDYISNVLPEMGEENVLQTTFHDYTLPFKEILPVEIEDRTTQLEFILSNLDSREFNTRVASIYYKTSAHFEQVIENYLAYFETELINDYPDIQFNGQTIFASEEWKSYYLNELAFLPPARRLAKIREIINIRIRPITHEIRRKKEKEIDERAEEVNKKTIKAMARIAARQELGDLINHIEKLTRLNPFVLYRKLFDNPEIFQRFSSSTVVPKEWQYIRKQTISSIARGTLPYEDSFAFLYFQGRLEGFQPRNSIKHLVIDEAQDYTTLQYKILTRLFPKCSWTILGDPVQRVHPYIQGACFDSLNKIINLENPRIIKLTRSYRSTLEIQAFCNSLLPSSEPAVYINRSGTLPLLVKSATLKLAHEYINKAIAELKSEGCRSIAIICKTIRESVILRDALQNPDISLIISETAEFRRGIVIMPAFLAKGLEFDGVIVANVNANSYRREAERNILYTVCTRALHRLVLCYHDEISPFIQSISPALYNSIES